jgi:hypothetical protein
MYVIGITFSNGHNTKHPNRGAFLVISNLACKNCHISLRFPPLHCLPSETYVPPRKAGAEGMGRGAGGEATETLLKLTVTPTGHTETPTGHTEASAGHREGTTWQSEASTGHTERST